MKTISVAIYICALFFMPSEPIKKDDCSCKGKKLYGKVKLVENYEDFKVKIVDRNENFRVVKTINPTRCGEWEIVDYFEDFTIKIVDAHEDFTIKFVDYFPGL